MRLFDIISRKKKRITTITIVSGLPRSGTSMMMQILEAGGIQAVTDQARIADSDNERGYYELEAVKALASGNHDCLIDAEGHALKVISTLLKRLPDHYHYKVIFMQRDIDSILASQNRMLNNLNKTSCADKDTELKPLYEKHLKSVANWLSKQDNIDVLYLNYNDVLEQPNQNIKTIINHLNTRLNKAAMVRCVDQSLCHHQYNA